ncbi:putative peptidase [Aspergillus clavatus NRRL 1]|uniref:Peptidase, putative n=1 Tax=Aspergillus clavatus (strain ATCC 1007 / CBS 513.65 / DSM 816 / NCTC 3887 / NRRL 1 / QM 1276 / 107) TaxID=344612 RepID=A1CAV6_ASPCL|nr:peptidase, putative [Aspergillus clavatus NRRL 1]EAW12874.1 peptidase, putative [Aspergillus clavatus NRRL 1]
MNMSDPPVVTLLKDLIQIPSTSEHEQDITRWLDTHLSRLGYTVERLPIAPASPRENIVAYLGSQRRVRVCLSSHTDTVPPHLPLRVEGSTIYGRGACDDKGSLAAQICALEELRAEGAVREGDVGLLFVVGEEKGGAGMYAANEHDLVFEGVVFGEPTEGKLVVGHKGHLVFELVGEGQACHSGYPQHGINANTALVQALGDFLSTEFPASPLLGPATFNIGKMEGGVNYNVVPGTSSALCAVRVATDMAECKRIVSEVAARHPHVSLEFKFDYPETLLDHDVDGWFFARLSDVDGY